MWQSLCGLSVAGMLWVALPAVAQEPPVKPANRFRTEKVSRGRFVATVGATGTLQPEEVVDIGPTVQGRILALGMDKNTRSRHIDFGSEVAGPVIDKDGSVIKA
jgi:HlyD family secretion protein